MKATATYALLVSALISPSFAAYQLAQDYSGDAFFQNFNFFTGPDPTQGHVQFQSMEAANASGLAGFVTGDNGKDAVYLGVDSKTNGTTGGRASTRVDSKQTFQHALVLADIAHSPSGVCGTWPAFWMLGPDWPKNGEIDIIEGKNNDPTNFMALHTSADIIVQNNAAGAANEVDTSNCNVNAQNQQQNQGCTIPDKSGTMFGSKFNANGGGMIALEWTSQFFKIWFFSRGQFPSDITAGKPVPSDSWGKPQSVFQGNFNLDDHFKNMQIVFDTTLCGGFAGGDAFKSSGCAPQGMTCEQFVDSNPDAFKEAYWAINTLQVFQDNGQGGGQPNATTANQAAESTQAAPQNSAYRYKPRSNAL